MKYRDREGPVLKTIRTHKAAMRPRYRRSLRRLWVSSRTGLGGCVYCTRGAFRAALIAWGLSALIAASRGSGYLAMLIGIVAFALTALWLAHLLGHAFKASGRGTGSSTQGGPSRRAILPVFVRAFAAAAIVTSLPRLAFGQCNSEEAARCNSAELDCRARCDQLYPQDERSRACRQDCVSNAAACKAAARCE